jgi:microfibrillar-associated protein 1
MRQRAQARAQIGVGQEEILEKEDEKAEVSAEEEVEETSEEESTDSEEEEGARLKPVFVRKKDRLTVQEKEKEDAKQRQLEREAEEGKKARRRETLRIVESTVKKEVTERKEKDSDPQGLHEVNTDDEHEELEYEAWKLRELKRMKRDRDEKEAIEKDSAETERLRNMTEEERRQELRNNPKAVTNKAAKGKYKFMQKYYHRGAFFMEKEEGLYKRDYSSATLEDNFDKTVLPKVMQVKNFGRSGRTKYTHLVDQDSTQFDAAWSQETTQNLKFQLNHAAGMKGGFERPSLKKKK